MYTEELVKTNGGAAFTYRVLWHGYPCYEVLVSTREPNTALERGREAFSDTLKNTLT